MKRILSMSCAALLSASCTPRPPEFLHCKGEWVNVMPPGKKSATSDYIVRYKTSFLGQSEASHYLWDPEKLKETPSCGFPDVYYPCEASVSDKLIRERYTENVDGMALHDVEITIDRETGSWLEKATVTGSQGMETYHVAGTCSKVGPFEGVAKRD
ncbi:MAG: hypothetical protein ACKOPO_06890 [Novosphingobium sp.]